ncbi:MAG: ribonuclease P protein component, partial [Planktomarina sp.]|nr:ribonuclease P protein component [Planktomarina sp.]
MIADVTEKKSGGYFSSGILSLARMTDRKDFLRMSQGSRVHSKSFVIQSRNRAEDLSVRVGFTCSKKVGNAVSRNRAKRRLREIARQVLPILGLPGYDYVLIGRASVTSSMDFEAMKKELVDALQKLNSTL